MVAEAPDQTLNLGTYMTNSNVKHSQRSIALEAARRLEAMIARTQQGTFLHQAMCSANSVVLGSGMLLSKQVEKSVYQSCSHQTRDIPTRH